MKKPGKLPDQAKARGRPRSEAGRSAILRAARELLDQGGPGAVTMEAVSARAGVGKPTVYRWYPDRHAVAMAALMERDAAASGDADARRRTAILALRDQLRAIARRFATSTGRHITSMIAASDAESELSKAFRNHFVLARRSEGRALLQSAIGQGAVRADVDLEVALDLLYGALFFRLLMGHAALDEAFVNDVVDEAMRGLSAQKQSGRRR
jgi:AcrR family transcriptional regulator